MTVCGGGFVTYFPEPSWAFKSFSIVIVKKTVLRLHCFEIGISQESLLRTNQLLFKKGLSQVLWMRGDMYIAPWRRTISVRDFVCFRMLTTRPECSMSVVAWSIARHICDSKPSNGMVINPWRLNFDFNLIPTLCKLNLNLFSINCWGFTKKKLSLFQTIYFQKMPKN